VRLVTGSVRCGERSAFEDQAEQAHRRHRQQQVDPETEAGRHHKEGDVGPSMTITRAKSNAMMPKTKILTRRHRGR
jgi:hypothetical protein